MNIKYLKYIKTASFVCGVIFVCSMPFSLLGMQFAVILAFILACISFLYSKKRVVFNPVDLSVMIYLFAVLFSWVSVAGLETDLMRMGGIWPIAGYFAAKGTFRRAFLTEKVQNVLLLITFIVACYAIGQYFLGYDLVRFSGIGSVYPSQADPTRFAVIGFFNRHNTFAISFTMIFAYLSAVYLYRKVNKFRWLSVAAFLCVMAAIVLAQSRVCWILLFVILFTLLAKHFRRKEIWVISAGCLLLVLAYVFFDANLLERFYGIFDLSGFSARSKIYYISSVLFAERPFSGWGFGRFFLQSDFLFTQLAPDINVRSGTHNEILTQLNSGSLLMLFAAINMATMSIIYATGLYYRKNRNEVIGVCLLLLCFAGAGLGHNVMVDGEISLVFWCFLGVLSSMNAEVDKSEAKLSD